MLELKDLRKRFGKTEALRGISLDVKPDELLVVLGPTGAGKTTLLRTIAGLEQPDGGAVRMDGRDVTVWPPAERDVALVFQNFSLYPGWTVRRNIEFPLRAHSRRLPESEIRERVEWAAGILKISHLLEREAQRLSGGEMQRVAIGRAIVRRPKIFLLDEPLTNLDAKLREALRVELVQLRRQLRTPMIFVTHDQAEALSMGDRIAVLCEGRILQTGTPEEVYRRPASPVVARQLGQPAINLFRVRRADGQWVTSAGVAVIDAAPGAESEMILGARPEDISPTGGAHSGTVRVVEDMGPTRTLLVQWAGQDIHIVTPKDPPLRPGDEVRPKFDPARVNLWPT
jgi:multiple sugar transport system ATP-binding protein